MIDVSIAGLFDPVLEDGLSRDSLVSVQAQLRAAHGELMRRRGADVGFYDVPLDDAICKAVRTQAKRLRALADDLLVLGIGGSSLGGQTLVRGLANDADRTVRAHFIDNVDPDTLSHTLERLSPERTAVVVITKSGETVETLAQLLIVRRWLRASLGQGEAHTRMTFVTDPDAGLLRGLAESEGIRSFEIPKNVGGRFSVLTAVGLLPAAFVGLDVDALLGGAAKMVERVTEDDPESNPAMLFAAGTLLAMRHKAASSLVMMPYADALTSLSAWFVQLWAESLGKRLDCDGNLVFAGQTPIAAIGVTDQHAQLQLFVDGPRDKAVVMVAVDEPHRALPIPDEFSEREEMQFLHGRDLGDLLVAERRGTRAALLSAGVPVIDLRVQRVDAATFGGLFVLLEAACALTGITMNINPFDHPGVDAQKRMTLGLLGRVGYEADAAQVQSREALEDGI